MRRALSLAKRGFPAPNPHVGCVLVSGHAIVGEGFHDHAGGLHAEAVALAKAGTRARGATAYVTLEPCNHQGRQPPCSLALIEAGVTRVVFAAPDPNAKASGGASALHAAAIQVEGGLLEAEARDVAEQFFFSIAHRRPLVVVKAAMTLDGRVAQPDGVSQWITGEASRRQGHRLRAELGAVLVGRRTVELDDPLLTARIPGVINQPLRVVLDPQGRLGAHYRVFGPESPTMHICRPFSLESLLADLLDRGVTGVLVEGGPTTVSSFVAAGLVDRFELFVAPRLLGAGPTWLNLESSFSVGGPPTLEIVRQRRLGGDVWITAKPAKA